MATTKTPSTQKPAAPRRKPAPADTTPTSPRRAPSREKPSAPAPTAAKSGSARRSTASLESTVREPLRVSPELRHHMIRDAAYFRAERRGFSGGDPLQDWAEAEAEIDRLLESGAASHRDGN